MIYLLTVVTFLLACPLEVSTYLRLENLKRVMVNKQMSVVRGVQNVTKDLCTSTCLVDSSSFDEARGTCLAFSPGIGRVMVQETRPKTGYPVYISKGQSSGMRQPCVNDNDCFINGSVCYKGRCMCTPGLSYHKAEQACVRKPSGMRQPCVSDNDCFINGSVCYKGRCMCTPGLSYHKAEQACVRKSSGMRQPCVSDNDCFINGSVCYKGRCMCTPGLSYHKAEQACVRKCRVYGKTMSMYEGLAITGHNTRTRLFLSKEKCIRLCTTRTNFLCLSVDISNFKCHLSTDGYLDVDQSNRMTDEDGWLFGTRDCE